jgi:hypothetical protein
MLVSFFQEGREIRSMMSDFLSFRLGNNSTASQILLGCQRVLFLFRHISIRFIVVIQSNGKPFLFLTLLVKNLSCRRLRRCFATQRLVLKERGGDLTQDNEWLSLEPSYRSLESPFYLIRAIRMWCSTCGFDSRIRMARDPVRHSMGVFFGSGAP